MEKLQKSKLHLWLKDFKCEKEIKPLDITDAIAIALTHAQRL